MKPILYITAIIMIPSLSFYGVYSTLELLRIKPGETITHQGFPSEGSEVVLTCATKVQRIDLPHEDGITWTTLVYKNGKWVIKEPTTKQ